MLFPSEQGSRGGSAPPAVLCPSGVSDMGGQFQWRGLEHPSVQTAAVLPPRPSHHIQVLHVPVFKSHAVKKQQQHKELLHFYPNFLFLLTEMSHITTQHEKALSQSPFLNCFIWGNVTSHVIFRLVFL